MPTTDKIVSIFSLNLQDDEITIFAPVSLSILFTLFTYSGQNSHNGYVPKPFG